MTRTLELVFDKCDDLAQLVARMVDLFFPCSVVLVRCDLGKIVQ